MKHSTTVMFQEKETGTSVSLHMVRGLGRCDEGGEKTRATLHAGSSWPKRRGVGRRTAIQT